MLLTSPLRRKHIERGFTLIELLVTLVVVSVGLLGVAKLQAAAVAETGVARTRSLMTFQAEALAASMRANEAFWQSSTAYTQSIAIAAGGTVSGGSLVQPGTSDNTCNSTSSCTPANLAYDDVNTWAAAFGQQFPTATGTIACTGSATTPETCDITLTWIEHSVAINRTTAAAATAGNGTSQQTSYMVLHVQP